MIKKLLLMRQFSKITAIFLAIFLLASCNQKPAKIVNNYHKFYGKNSPYNKRYPSNRHAGNYLEVNPGDTLYGIAKENEVNLRDLIELNNLKAPYNLIAGTKLKVPNASKQFHEVKEGETLYEISRNYNIKMDSLISLNNLEKPYVLKPGQKIIITNNARSSQEIFTRKRLAKDNSSSFGQKLISKFKGSSSNKFSWPVKGRVISNFGPKSGGLYNDGINIKVAKGTPVSAAQNGVVAYVGNELKGYGNLVIIKHKNKYITAYAHLSKFSVKRGDKISQGQEVGLVGSSGNVSSPQLYFGLRKGRDAINPKKYLR